MTATTSRFPADPRCRPRLPSADKPAARPSATPFFRSLLRPGSGRAAPSSRSDPGAEGCRLPAPRGRRRAPAPAAGPSAAAPPQPHLPPRLRAALPRRTGRPPRAAPEARRPAWAATAAARRGDRPAAAGASCPCAGEDHQPARGRCRVPRSAGEPRHRRLFTSGRRGGPGQRSAAAALRAGRQALGAAAQPPPSGPVAAPYPRGTWARSGARLRGAGGSPPAVAQGLRGR